MDEKGLTNRDVMSMAAVISQSLHLSLQALRHSVSVAAVLVDKGMVAKAELDEAIRATERSARALQAAFAQIEERNDPSSTIPSPFSRSIV